mmetsp:Transcript_73351/g.116110  ORF Transcript_73351/g.116110 Transcript_73351/m.116110 type:complete len:793 (-) Transcript_73351:40-2418(-)
MLRKATGSASAARHSRRAERRGSEKVAVRRAAHIPLGRPFVYEPHRTGHEPIALCELQALYELETESSPSVGSDNEGPGWKALLDSDGAKCEQWLPEPEDPNEAQLCIFRTSLNLPGIPPSVAFEQLYEVSKRRTWDSRLARLRQVKSAPRREGEGGVQSDLLHLRVDPLLSFLPACEFVLWRGCLSEPAVDGLGGSDPVAFLLRNAEVEVNDDIDDDTSGDWLGPIRVRKLVHGCIVRSLDPENHQAGSRIFGYVQIKVNSTLQYLVPSLAAELAMGSRDSFRTACATAVAALKPISRSLSIGMMKRHNCSAYESDSDVSVCTSMCEFLGGVPSSALASRKERRRVTRQSLVNRRCSAFSERPVLRGVQLHRCSSFSALDRTPLPSPVSDTASEPEFLTNTRRAARRARSQASQRQSMAVFADRLTEVMTVRGSVLETLAEDAEADMCQDTASTPPTLVLPQPSLAEPEKVALIRASPSVAACEPLQESPTRKRFSFPAPTRRIRDADRGSEHQAADQTFAWLASPQPTAEQDQIRINIERKSVASSTPSTPRSEWFDGSAQEKPTESNFRNDDSASEKHTENSLRNAVSKIMMLGRAATSIASHSSHTEVQRTKLSSTTPNDVDAKIGSLKQVSVARVSTPSDKIHLENEDEFSHEQSQDRRKNEPEPSPEPGPDTISCLGSPSRRSLEDDVMKMNLEIDLEDFASVHSSESKQSAKQTLYSGVSAVSAAESLLFCTSKELITVSRIRKKESSKKRSEEKRKSGDERRKHKNPEEGKQRKSKRKEDEVWV